MFDDVSVISFVFRSFHFLFDDVSVISFVFRSFHLFFDHFIRVEIKNTSKIQVACKNESKATDYIAPLIYGMDALDATHTISSHVFVVETSTARMQSVLLASIARAMMMIGPVEPRFGPLRGAER